MKKIFTLAFSLFCFLGMAQTVSMEEINKEVKSIAKMYKFDESQKAKLSEIIIKKYQDLQDVESLREGDVKVYRQKRRALHMGTQGSIELLLNRGNEKQMSLFNKQRKKERVENAKRVQALKDSNADIEDIKDAKIGLYN